MKTWQDRKIGTRLGVVFGAILLCVIGVGGFGLSWLGRLNSNMSSTLQTRYKTVELTHQTIENSITNARITLQLFETPNLDEEKKLNQENEAISHEISAQVAEIEKSLSNSQEREQVETVTQNRQAYISARNKAKAMLADKKRDLAMATLSSEVIPALDKYRASWQKFIDLQTAAMAQSMKQSQDAYAVGRAIGLVILVFTLVLTTFAAFSVTKSITVPIQQSVAHAERIAAGDLTQDIVVTNRSETGQLQQAMQEMSNRLSGIIRDVREGSAAVASAAQQVSASSQSLSQGTSEQAASVEEMSSSLEQMNASITQNADNSRQVEQAAAKGASAAEESGDAVKETVGAMKQIAAKIGVIEEIAYQTNLLALNAAIEAARAGDQGRGFAVVAGEVRRLAESTAQATGEIASMIQGIQDRTLTAIASMESGTGTVQQGVITTNQAGEALERIIGMAERVDRMIAQIAIAASQQTAAADQSSASLDAIHSLSHENLTEMATTAAGIESLRTTAVTLEQQVDRFSLKSAPDTRLIPSTSG